MRVTLQCKEKPGRENVSGFSFRLRRKKRLGMGYDRKNWQQNRAFSTER